MNSSPPAFGGWRPQSPSSSWCCCSDRLRSTSITAPSRWSLKVQERVPPLLISVLCIGIAVLYVPIVVLIAYSFNASPLVSVWGGFSTRSDTQLLHNDQMHDAAWQYLQLGRTGSTES